jgi:hypothetical protein
MDLLGSALLLIRPVRLGPALLARLRGTLVAQPAPLNLPRLVNRNSRQLATACRDDKIYLPFRRRAWMGRVRFSY